MPSGMSRRDCNTTRVYTTKIPIVSIPIGREKDVGRELIGNYGNKGNNKKDNMKNNIISKIEWKVKLLFDEPFKVKGNSTTASSSSSTTSNYPLITITLNSVNEDVTINEMLNSVFKIPEKSNNNNDDGTQLIQHN